MIFLHFRIIFLTCTPRPVYCSLSKCNNELWQILRPLHLHSVFGLGIGLYLSSPTGENTPQYPHKTLYGQDLFPLNSDITLASRRHAIVFPIIMTLKGNIWISIYTSILSIFRNISLIAKTIYPRTNIEKNIKMQDKNVLPFHTK